MEVSGFGLCQTVSPYSVLVIGVQQETFQSWNVYRRFSCFLQLYQQLHQFHPSIPPVPSFNPDDLSIANLDLCRSSLDEWLQSISANPMILRTQHMYQFLCLEANQPPPYLEIHWRTHANGSFDEMDMDEMFERVDEEHETDEEDDDDMDECGGGGVGEIHGRWEEEELSPGTDNTRSSGGHSESGKTTTATVTPGYFISFLYYRPPIILTTNQSPNTKPSLTPIPDTTNKLKRTN